MLAVTRQRIREMYHLRAECVCCASVALNIEHDRTELGISNVFGNMCIYFVIEIIREIWYNRLIITQFSYNITQKTNYLCILIIFSELHKYSL